MTTLHEWSSISLPPAQHRGVSHLAASGCPHTSLETEETEACSKMHSVLTSKTLPAQAAASLNPHRCYVSGKLGEIIAGEGTLDQQAALHYPSFSVVLGWSGGLDHAGQALYHRATFPALFVKLPGLALNLRSSASGPHPYPQVAGIASVHHLRSWFYSFQHL